MSLHKHEVSSILKDLRPFYYHYQMLESILEKTDKELEEYNALKQQLRKYMILLQDALPYASELQKIDITNYLVKLTRCI